MPVIGVDGFGGINQLHGHAFGDLLLKAIAERVRASVRVENLLVRSAGDEFAIEVSEFGAMRNAELSLLNLRKLVACGVRMSLYDFGVGYSSPVHLKRFPVQDLKTDRSLISCMNDCSES